MAEETTISTPDVETSKDTSTSVEPTNDVDTSTVEPEGVQNTAETETESAEGTQERLYANKYKTVEELEKGYAETQKVFNEKAELQKKYDALINERKEAAEKAQIEALRQAQQRGFNSVEAQQIADRVQVAELEYYANNLDLVNPQDYENCRNALANYYNTGHKSFLEEAKRYFNADFVEKVALAKNDLKNKMHQEFEARNKELLAQNEQKLAEVIKSEYGEFLTSISENEPVKKALEIFCDTGHIQSKEDMGVFVDLINKMQSFYKEQAIKEYEAQKTIEATKGKAVIEGNGTESNEAHYTVNDVSKMSQKEFDDYCKKHGTDWLYK